MVRITPPRAACCITSHSHRRTSQSGDGPCSAPTAARSPASHREEISKLSVPRSSVSSFPPTPRYITRSQWVSSLWSRCCDVRAHASVCRSGKRDGREEEVEGGRGGGVGDRPRSLGAPPSCKLGNDVVGSGCCGDVGAGSGGGGCAGGAMVGCARRSTTMVTRRSTTTVPRRSTSRRSSSSSTSIKTSLAAVLLAPSL